MKLITKTTAFTLSAALLLSTTSFAESRVIGTTLTYTCDNNIKLQHVNSIYSLPGIRAEYQGSEFDSKNLDVFKAHSLEVIGLDGQKILNSQIRGQDRVSKQSIQLEVSASKADFPQKNSFEIVSLIVIRGSDHKVLVQKTETANCRLTDRVEHTFE